MSHRLPVIPWVQSRLSCSERQSFGWLQAVQGHNALGSAISAPRSIDPKQNICFVSLPAEETRREGGCVQLRWAGLLLAAVLLQLNPMQPPTITEMGEGMQSPYGGRAAAFPHFHVSTQVLRLHGGRARIASLLMLMMIRGEGGVGARTTNPGSSHAPPFRCRCSARPRGGGGRPTRGPAMSSGQGR